MFSFSAAVVSGSKRKAMMSVGLLVAGLGAAAMLARGQNTPAGDNQAGATLTNEQIGQALDTYGKNTVNANGHTEYNITVTKGKWNIQVLVNLSRNGKVIWLTNSLAAMPEPGKVSAAALTEVLKKNSEIGPMFFGVANGGLRLLYPVPNYELTPASFRSHVDALVATVLDTEGVWNADALAGRAGPAGPAAPAAPVAPGPVNPLSR